MYPHRIRLHGPWEVEPIAPMVRLADGSVETPPTAIPPGVRMTMPIRWQESGLKDFVGRVRFRRRFGYPGRIDTYERVWLTFDQIPGTWQLSLNGTILGNSGGADNAIEFEVTQLLRERNELVVQVDVPSGEWGEVALEVRCTAFLRSVEVLGRCNGSVLDVTGEVVGASAGPLELYILVDGRTQHYGVVQASSEGVPFRVQLQHASADQCHHLVRIDLVQGAMLWYAVERVVTLEKI